MSEPPPSPTKHAIDVPIEPLDADQTISITPSMSTDGEMGRTLLFNVPDDNDGNENTLTIYSIDEEQIMNPNSTLNMYHEEENLEFSMNVDRAPTVGKVDEAKKFACSLCSYKSSRRYSLKRHMKTHKQHYGPGHKCYFCTEVFPTSNERARHIRYCHTYEKRYTCSQCEYSCVEMSSLRYHMKGHAGERPYECPNCKRSFTDSAQLERHIQQKHQTIAAEKPYKCHLCPVTCARSGDLRVHVLKQHMSGEPIQCKRCDKSFPDRGTFNSHYKTHIGEEFKCQKCTYASRDYYKLTSHMRIHSDERPFHCDKCNLTFRQKQVLNRHMIHQHNTVLPPPEEKIGDQFDKVEELEEGVESPNDAK